MKPKSDITEAEEILNNFIKGHIVRDYDEADRKYYTIPLETALEAINTPIQKYRKREDKWSLIIALLIVVCGFLSFAVAMLW